VRDRWVPVVAVSAPAICWVLDRQQAAWFGGWQIGLEMLVLNGAITFGLLLLASRERTA
jgi:hypothetical protein